MPSVSTQSGTTNYGYDGSDHLASEQSTRDGGYSDSFVFDSAGNPTTFRNSGQSYDTDNQLSGGGFTFDGNGNPTSYGGTSLGFDAESRLTSLGSSWTAAYRRDGLRAWKQTGATQTYFLYDDRERPLVELSASGSVLALNLYGPAGLFARTTSSGTISYTFDPQGNVAQRLNSNQTILSSSVYDSYGLESSAGSPTDPFGYNAVGGYYLDRETGLYLCGYRYFDPGRGRFLNRDLIRFSGGINLYAYCAGNPLGRSDSTGLDWCGTGNIPSGDDPMTTSLCFWCDWIPPVPTENPDPYPDDSPLPNPSPGSSPSPVGNQPPAPCNSDGSFEGSEYPGGEPDWFDKFDDPQNNLARCLKDAGYYAAQDDHNIAGMKAAWDSCRMKMIIYDGYDPGPFRG